MMDRIVVTFLIVSAFPGVGAARVPAQVPTGTVSGIISDPHDAVVPNAHVVAIITAQGVSRETSSNADGLYAFANLPAGIYELKIEPLVLPPLNSRTLSSRRAAQLHSTPGCRSRAPAQRSR